MPTCPVRHQIWFWLTGEHTKLSLLLYHAMFLGLVVCLTILPALLPALGGHVSCAVAITTVAYCCVKWGMAYSLPAEAGKGQSHWRPPILPPNPVTPLVYSAPESLEAVRATETLPSHGKYCFSAFSKWACHILWLCPHPHIRGQLTVFPRVSGTCLGKWPTVYFIRWSWGSGCAKWGWQHGLALWSLV